VIRVFFSNTFIDISPLAFSNGFDKGKAKKEEYLYFSANLK